MNVAPSSMASWFETRSPVSEAVEPRARTLFITVTLPDDLAGEAQGLGHDVALDIRAFFHDGKDVACDGAFCNLAVEGELALEFKGACDFDVVEDGAFGGQRFVHLENFDRWVLGSSIESRMSQQGSRMMFIRHRLHAGVGAY
jgi:hypothetical protein